jgi:hypothetical protein
MSDGHGGHGGGGHEKKGHGGHEKGGHSKEGGMGRRDFLKTFAMLFGIPQWIQITDVPISRNSVQDFLKDFPAMKFASFWNPGKGGGGGGGHSGGGHGGGGHH